MAQENKPLPQVGGTHYQDKQYQPIEVMRDWLSPEQFEGFLRGNAIKYLARYPEKGGLQDVKKAQWYTDTLVEFMENKNETIS